MGVNKRRRHERGKRRVRRQKSGQDAFSFHDVDAQVLRDLIERVTAADGLVMFMATRDGYLRGVRLKHDDIVDEGTVWVSSEEQLTNYAEDFLETLSAEPDA
jgi:hypothetical protein